MPKVFSYDQVKRFLPGTGLLALALLMSACATHPKGAAAATPAMKVKRAQAVGVSAKPLRPISLSPAPTEPVEGRTIKNIELTKSQQIALLVHGGILVEGTENSLFFVRSRNQLSSPSGLFEDAVTLANLRQRLNDVKDLPVGISSTATVRDATAFIKFDEDLSAACGANAIEAALKAKGVVAVRARILSSMRL